MVGRALLSVQRLGDVHLAFLWIDVEHFVRRLIRSHARDAVSDVNGAIFIGTDLEKRWKDL